MVLLETATAIGAEIAVCLGAKYIQTTREVIEGVEYLYFSEEHSHATEQKLVKDDIDAVIDDIDRIVFAEDEVTTGKTILNIIDRIEQYYPGKVKFSVASLLNGMSKEHLAQYEERKINLHYLVKPVMRNMKSWRQRLRKMENIMHVCRKRRMHFRSWS